MKVLSVNVGTPKQYDWMGQPVTTSIFKSPVEGEVRVRPWISPATTSPT